MSSSRDTRRGDGVGVPHRIGWQLFISQDFILCLYEFSYSDIFHFHIQELQDRATGSIAKLKKEASELVLCLIEYTNECVKS